MSDIRANVETEMSLLGCLMGSPDQIDTAQREGLQAEHFYHPENRLIYESIFDLWSKRVPVSIITVSNHLRDTVSSTEQTVNSIRCEQCLDMGVTGSHVPYYVREIRKQHDKISLDMILTESKEMIREGDETSGIVASLIAQVEEAFYSNVEKLSHLEMVGKITQNFKSASRGDGVYIPSRFLPIQRKTAGKRRGKITIIAARPGVGKTTLTVNEAKHDLDNGYKVGIISLEMDKEEIFSILACDNASLNLHKLNSGDAEPHDIKTFREQAMTFESKPIWVCDKSMNIYQILSWIRNNVRKNNLDIIYIDYIQLIKTQNSQNQKRHEEVANWSHLLAECAKECGIAIVLCSQIRRSYEPSGREASEKEAWKHVPRLDQLKDSGALEEDAYIVILLYPYPGDDTSLMTVRYIADVAKHRGGPTGTCDLVFKKNNQRFEAYGV